MGTPEFAVPSLKMLIKEHEVLAVVTQPDRKRGRGQQMTFSPVKEVAVSHNLLVLQPERVAETSVMEQLEELRADVFVIVAFGQKIPDRLLNMPSYGCINVHSSLLPKYRGAAPINAAIVHGEMITGVSTMYLASQWDAGDIILQSEEPIYSSDTAGDLHDRLMVKGAELLQETLAQIASGRAPRVPQDHSAATFAFKLSKEDAWLDFQRPAEELGRLVRGMNPWPLAHTLIGGESVKILEASPSDQNGAPGEILACDENGLLIGCGTGSLYLHKLQRPNSKAITGMDFANGLRLRTGDFLSR